MTCDHYQVLYDRLNVDFCSNMTTGARTPHAARSTQRMPLPGLPRLDSCSRALPGYPLVIESKRYRVDVVDFQVLARSATTTAAVAAARAHAAKHAR